MAVHTRVIVMTCEEYAYGRGVVRGVQQYAKTNMNWEVIRVNSKKWINRKFDELRPDGIVCHIDNSELADYIAGLDVPVINTAGEFFDLPFPRIGVDDIAVGRMVADHFIERGFHHIAYIGPPGVDIGEVRQHGFTQRMNEVGVTEYSSISIGGVGTDTPDVANIGRLKRWLMELPKPLAVFAFNDLFALWVIRACQEEGLSVPDAVAVVGVDNDELFWDAANMPISSVVQALERLGRTAAELLARSMMGAAVAQTTLIPPLRIATRRSSDVLAIEDLDVKAALEFLRSHADEDIEVDDLLAVVPMCRRTLERRFLEVMHHGPQEELRRIRMEHAKVRMVDSEISIHDIAQRAGYASLAHFSTVFRKFTGTTPTTYRRLNRTEC